MDLGDFVARSGTVTEVRWRRTCVRSFFFAGTLARDVHWGDYNPITILSAGANPL